MEKLPVYIAVVFICTTLLTVTFFYKASHHSKATLLILSGWLLLQAMIALPGFYTETRGMPPRFMLTIVPPLLFITLLFATTKGRQYVDSLDIKTLTILHVVRVPVEIVLLWLFLQQAIPQLMTFEGRNFDLVSGLTAPIVYYLGFVKKQFGFKLIIAWNVICLGLLINIVINAVLAAPFPFQLFAFDQPNVAVLYFPYVWLPACIVPLVLLAHLVAIRQLLLAGSPANVHDNSAAEAHLI